MRVMTVAWFLDEIIFDDNNRREGKSRYQQTVGSCSSLSEHRCGAALFSLYVCKPMYTCSARPSRGVPVSVGVRAARAPRSVRSPVSFRGEEKRSSFVWSWIVTP